MPVAPDSPPTPEAQTGTIAGLPSTCRIHGLVAFGPGFFKDELYSPARCDQVADNFAATGGRPVPLAKIGHDPQQQFARSLGFINVGIVTRVQKLHGGCWEVDIDDVPTEVGGQVSAGRLRGASVELKSHQRDPKNPAVEIPGDVLTGISLLGNEQPCVQNWVEDLRPRAIPRATFADGRPVPADPNVARWLNMAAEVSDKIVASEGGQYSADRLTVRIRGRTYAAHTLCFSDFEPSKPGPTMTPEQEAALQAAGFTPDQIAAMKAALPAAPAAAPPPPAAMAAPAPPPAAPVAKAMSAEEMSACIKKMSAELEENKKQTGALMASADAAQKKDEEAKMAAFSDRVAQAVAPLYERRPPVVIETVDKPTLMGVLTSKAFSAETDRVKAFNDYLAPLLALPRSPLLPSGKPAAVMTTEHMLTADNPFLAAAVRKGGRLDLRAPDLAKAIREPAAV